jgi:uncharacterized protein (TIGR00299 family) protein
MSSLYFECSSGISGDMAVAALLDAGADQKVLEDVLKTIPASGFRTEITRVKKNGIDVCDFNVILDAEYENHDHDMEYLFGHEEGHEQGQAHEHNHSHEHEHGHSHEHEDSHEHGHHHEHRNLSDVFSIIDACKMTEGARNLAHKIFTIIAGAESQAHGIPVEEVHFHEVGAIDSIVDVIALAVCFDNLSSEKVYVPFLNEGSGFVRCQHGILPIPVPAVANIAAAYSLPLHIMKDKGEFITPTGAAFIAAVMTDKLLPETFSIKKIGLGGGKRAYEKPSIVRAYLIEEDSSEREDQLYKLETNIDDCTGEALGFVMDELFKAGALDVHYVPCIMKKNRPAYILYVLCKENNISNLENIIYNHTTTIGIRRFRFERSVLPRCIKEVNTPYGPAKVKVTEVNNQKRYYPEYESVAKLTRETGKAFNDVFREIVEICLEQQL